MIAAQMTAKTRAAIARKGVRGGGKDQLEAWLIVSGFDRRRPINLRENMDGSLTFYQ